ncbi:MAG: efflux RND transporter permease subunit [Steroidobacteraceae bacterium]|nr:efflux RND transporter permease subunit [Steroidobacteraceae bacterium]
MKLSEVSIRRPVFATVISLMLIILGLVSLTRLSVREFPDVDAPIVSISTNYRGAGASIVENKITQLIEDRIAGIEGIDKLRSQSVDDRSNVTVEFTLDRGIDEAANDIRDRVSRVLGNLPPEADPPEIAKADANGEAIIYINLTSDNMSVLELSDYAERYLRDRLSALPGVARVNINGVRRYSMRLWIDREALAARRLTVADIESALRRENVESPAGRLESQQREFALRTDTGLRNAEDFKNLAIGKSAEGYIVRLGEVADVRLGAENERTLARSMGIAGVSMGIEQASKANTLEVAQAVRAEVATLQQGLPEGMELGINIDRSIFIEASLKEVEIALVISLVLVLGVIYLFLGNIRATLIPAVTIPVSIIATFIFMDAMGYSINVLTLLGLVLAIGLVVDDAIVVLENIFRRIEQGQPPLVAAIDGSREIGFAVIATTLVLVAVFVPISFLPGNLGRLFREFGFTLAAAVLFSALIALTLTPAMASRMFRGDEKRSGLAERVDRFFRRLSAGYEKRLRSLIRRPVLVVASSLVLVAVAAVMFRGLPQEFAPQEDRGMLFISLQGPEGASLDYMNGYARQLEDILFRELESGDIKRFIVRVPGSMRGGGGGGGDVNSASSFVVLEDWGLRKRSADQMIEVLRKAVNQLPGVRANVFQPQGLSSRGFGQPVQAVIGGPDYETLAQWSDKLQAVASRNPGLVNVDTDYRERKPQINVMVDRDRAADLGVSLQTVGRTLETVLGSRIVTTFVDRGREYNVILQGGIEDRAQPSDLENLYVRSDRTGELVPLSNLVTLRESAGAISLNRFDRLRSVTINAGLAPGYTLGEAVKWFQDTVKAELPPDARLSFDGESREFLKSQGQLYVTFLLALAIVFLVLAAQFESFRHPLIIMTTVPLAIIGALAGLWLYNMTLNIFSQIAMIMLIGIAAKNGVLIVEFANQLRDKGLERVDAVVEAAATRLRPVLMTSLCTAFGALPFLMATGAGKEQREPIGVVVFYGTLIAVMLTLFVVPAVYTLVAVKHESPNYLSGLIERLRGGTATAAEPAGAPAEGGDRG